MLLVGLSAGMAITYRYMTYTQKQKINTDRIAVVNLDEGVVTADGTQYYAADLVSYPGDNFVQTSLEEARGGLADNIFAGYIVIPSDFSESVQSLNSTPVKASIQYAINPNLTDSMKYIVGSDINGFNSMMSERFSYTYVSSILDDFHTAQDDARSVLKNDNADLRNVMAIDADRLTEEPEYTELQIAEYDIEYPDMAENTKINTECIEDIMKLYEEAQTKNIEDVASYMEKLEGIANAQEEFTESLSELHFMEDEEGKLIIQDDIDELDEKLYLTRDARLRCIKDLKILVKTNLYNQEALFQTYIDESLNDIKQSEQNAYNEWYEELKNSNVGSGISWSEPFNVLDNCCIDLENARPIEAHDANTEPIIELNNPNLSEEENRRNEIIAFYAMDGELSDKIDTIDFASDEIVGKIKNDIEPKVIEQLKEGCNSVMEKLSSLNTTVSEYLKELNKFNLLENLEDDIIRDDLQKLNENILDMQEVISENTAKELDYVSEVITVTEENVQNLQDNIFSANEKTKDNVDRTILTLKNNRQALNEQNEVILTDFAGKLPYTQIGSIENRNLYSFVVSPVTFTEIKSVNVTDNGIIDIYIGIVVGIFVLLSLCIVAMEVMFLRNRRNDYE